jgi:hypothetical protein
MYKAKELLRWKEWGDSKLPFVIIAWLLTSLQMPSQNANWIVLIHTLAFSVCYLSFGYMFNDWIDSDVDKRAGKIKSIHSMPTWQILLIITILIILGISFVFPWLTNPLVFINVSICYFFAVTYSGTSLRFKERGGTGILVASLSQRTMLVSLVFIVTEKFNMIAVLFLGLTLIIGFRWMLTHQLDDYERDLEGGVKTFTTQNSMRMSSRLLTWLFNTEIVLLVFFPLFFSIIEFWIIYFIYALFTIAMSKAFSNTPWQMLQTPSTAYLVLADFYFLYWPLGLAIIYAIYQPISWLVVFFLLILLANYIKQHLSELKFLAQRIIPSKT